MSQHSTRATDPQADPRQPFTLSKADAQALDALAQQTSDPNLEGRLNAWWCETAQRMGFVWNTVAELEFDADASGTTTGATFTAWPTSMPIAEDADAIAWVDAECARLANAGPIPAPHRPSEPTDMFTRDFVLRAWAAGRDTGFAMGSRVTGWDGMELIRESMELFRSYQAHHEAEAERLHDDVANYDDPEQYTDRAKVEQAARNRVQKAERNRVMAEKLKAFLADPHQSHLVHDGLREARDDAATASLAGWWAAILQVRELVEKGKVGNESTIPPLVMLSALERLGPPTDMDEVFQRLRDPMSQVQRLLRQVERAHDAMDEWFEKSEWLDEALRLGLAKKLGLPSQLGRHKADILHTLVDHMAELLADSRNVPFERGTRFVKAKGHNFGDGDAVVLACYRTLAGGWRVVGEHPEGWQFIFTPDQIAPIPTDAEHRGGVFDPRCPDCRAYAEADEATPAETVRKIEAAVAAGLIPGLDQAALDEARAARPKPDLGPHGDEEPSRGVVIGTALADSVDLGDGEHAVTVLLGLDDCGAEMDPALRGLGKEA